MWNVRNDRYQRSLCLEDYPKNTLVILCDFSAVLSMVGQDTLTCHQPNEAIQEVFVCCHGIKNEEEIRSHTVDAGHFWGHYAKSNTKHLKKSSNDDENDETGRLIYQNTAYHVACLEKLIHDYQLNWPGLYNCELEHIEIFSDGCKGQYKSRFHANFVSALSQKLDLKDIILTWAPTANFKCCVEC